MEVTHSAPCRKDGGEPGEKSSWKAKDKVGLRVGGSTKWVKLDNSLTLIFIKKLLQLIDVISALV